MDFVVSILGWTVLWLFTTFIFNTMLFSCLSSTRQMYKKMSWQNKLDWNARSTSLLHSIVCVYYAVTALLYHLNSLDIFGYNIQSATAVEIATGFFLSDFVVISLLFYHYGAKQYVQFAAHHVVAVVAFGMVLYYRQMMWFANFRLLSEISTPFLNFRWFMQRMGDRSSALYNFNRLAFFGVFALCRIATIPRYWITVYHVHHDIALISKQMIGILLVSGAVLDGLNLFWFYLMFKIVLSTTPSIKPLMEKKKIEFSLATQEFQERMKLINHRNREKLSTFKSSVASSMTDIRTRLNTAGMKLKRN